jgi:hypothetical protein
MDAEKDSLPNPYQDALDAAKEELAKCLEKQAGLTDRIKTLQMTIASLQAVTGEIPAEAMLQVFSGFDPDAGITNAVRHFLAINSDRTFTAAKIRAGLQFMGFRLPIYSNVYAVISKVLERLRKSHEVLSLKTPQGHTVYRWGGGFPPGGFGKTRAKLEKQLIPAEVLKAIEKSGATEKRGEKARRQK